MTLPGPHSLPRYLDCSSAVTTIYEAAGFGDPNGRHYDGQGYTGTLVARGRKVSVAKMQPCDLVFYGYTSVARPGFPVGSPTHVGMVMDRNGAIFTFGSDPGPSFRHIRYRSDLHSIRRYIANIPRPEPDL
jgi:cell wall-associated NlpC family hydrolase